MITFILRRLLAAFFIVLGASYIVDMLMAHSGDPLAFSQEIQKPVHRVALQRYIIDSLNLDVHPVPRYFQWLQDVLQGDFGESARTQQPVREDLGRRLLMTLKLVTAATVLSIVVGTCVGIVTALRQYSGFDYT